MNLKELQTAWNKSPGDVYITRNGETYRVVTMPRMGDPLMMRGMTLEDNWGGYGWWMVWALKDFELATTPKDWGKKWETVNDY